MEGKIIFMAAASDQDCFCIVTLTPGSEKPWFLLVCHACSSSSLWSMLYIFAINYFYFLLLVTRNPRRFTVIITIQTVFILHCTLISDCSGWNPGSTFTKSVILWSFLIFPNYLFRLSNMEIIMIPIS